MRRLLELLRELLPLETAQHNRLVRLPMDRSIVFVGDIHGDSNAVETVFSKFPTNDHVIVFLGDVVDRGPDSLGALSMILEERLKDCSSVHLLMGNHEAWGISRFTPADFWDSLPPSQSRELASHLMHLPLAAWHPSGVLATHGALPPDLPTLEAIDGIKPGSEEWRAVTWGDWVGEDRSSIVIGSRPAFGPAAFERRLSRLGAKTLIRSHQPTALSYLFDDRCLTLFTSTAYGDGPRQVARLMSGQQLQTARDLQLIEI